MKSHKIEPLHVLDHPSARLGHRAVRLHHLQPDRQVANAAHVGAHRPNRVRRQRAANSCRSRLRRVKVQALARLPKHRLQLRDPSAAADNDGQVRRLIFDYAGDSSEIDCNVVPLRGVAKAHPRPATPRDNRLAC